MWIVCKSRHSDKYVLYQLSHFLLHVYRAFFLKFLTKIHIWSVFEQSENFVTSPSKQPYWYFVMGINGPLYSPLALIYPFNGIMLPLIFILLPGNQLYMCCHYFNIQLKIIRLQYLLQSEHTRLNLYNFDPFFQLLKCNS